MGRKARIASYKATKPIEIPQEKKTLNKLKDIAFRDLPIPHKVVAVDTLHNDLKLEMKTIATEMGMSRNRLYDYLKVEKVPEGPEYDIFKEQVKKIFEAKRSKLKAKVYQKLEDGLPDADFRDKVGLVKILEDVDRADRPTTNTPQSTFYQFNKYGK
jgi:hypothetical protein